MNSVLAGRRENVVIVAPGRVIDRYTVDVGTGGMKVVVCDTNSGITD